MSGKKDLVVALRQSEYDRMMSACKRVGDIDAEILRAVKQRESEIRHDYQKDIDRRCEALAQSQHQSDKKLQEIQHAHNDATKAQARESARKFASLDQRIDSNRSELLGVIKEHKRESSDLLRRQREELVARIDEINAAARSRQFKEQELCANWLRDATAFVDALDHTSRHEKFAPGAMSGLRARLAIASANARQDQCQAALMLAQNVFVDSKELEIRLSQLEFEWNTYLAEARRRSAETIAACEAQANCKFTFDSEALNLDVNTPAVEVAAEIDYWTRGGLTELLTRTRYELGKVFKPEVNALTVDDLRKLADRSQELRTDLDRLTAQARQALIASQLRHNIARRIEMALGDEGWEVIDSAFEGEDQRDALHVKLGHQNGAEVVAEICPQAASDSAISNLVSVSFFDDGVTNHRLIDTRLRRVLESVATEGVEVGSPTCAPGFERSLRGPESARDFERVRQHKRVEARRRS